MKVVPSSGNTMTNQAFVVHSIAQYMKVVLLTYNTFSNPTFGVHSIR
jgi:hypothetical protein